MTDNEIVKALEYCTNCVCNNDKDECPLLKMSFCKNYLMKQSLDLINRQQAEIEMDDVEIKELRIALQGYLGDLTKERNLYKKSIEELNQAKAEIERLKTNLNIELENYATEYDNKIKAEAYREFAELLKCDWIANLYYCEDLDITDWIDNLLKELVGDSNG